MQNYKIVEFIVDANNQRIDLFLKNHLQLSRTYIQNLIKNEQITLNNKVIVKKHCFVFENDHIIVKLNLNFQRLNFQKTKRKVEIIFENEHYAIINKPNHLITHPCNSTKEVTLVDILQNQISNLAIVNDVYRPGIVHRLDKDTTGLMIIAKSKLYFEYLSKCFLNKTIKRNYLALVHGHFKFKNNQINLPIGRCKKDPKKQCVDFLNGKPAITNFKVLKTFQDFSLLKCQLETGRTHQIRVHLSYLNHPIYGDHKYGKSSDQKVKFKQFLHSYKLFFYDFINKKEISYKISMPLIMKNFINKLK